ncbi:MAG: alanine racemase [Desulfuromonadales bacterium]|nr:alanine racemase [Desulfuromonadales bacterium]
MSRPTRAEIDLSALQQNLRQVRRTVGAHCQILAMVKADAYGHGVRGVAPALAAAGVEQFAVALVDEARELRELGLSQPILVMGGIFAGEEDLVVALDLQPIVDDLAAAQRLDRAGRQAGRIIDYHLKIDTGMGRLGLPPEELGAFLPRLAELSHLRMTGLMSHLAVADEPHRRLNDRQIASFRAQIARVEAAGFSPHFRHLANSAALYSRDLPDCNLVRPGIALYGGLTGETATAEIAQQPVMRLVSAVARLRAIAPGTGVSYGHRFVASRPSRVAAIPIGYGDGYNRLLSGRGEVLIGGRRATVAGTVCMDWTMVDVTDLPDVKIGDPVTLLGRDGDDQISAAEWAEQVGSITYEVFCNISRRVPRVFVGG